MINLATQAFLTTYSHASHYNPASPDDHIPDLDEPGRDVIGLVRAISVKVH